MNRLVKILTSDTGDVHDDPKWHFIDISPSVDAPRTLCGGEAFGYGESGCKYETKQVVRGGSDCPECIAAVKAYKSIKL